ncbi:hypothetical protein AGMMS49957_00520 [Synergistales bacterium]|nr:hypothetical protein AGMMS49957_00520 [Synergistales bacterium]
MSTHPSDVWLDKARLTIYERIKDMTPEERVAYFNASGEAVAKEFPNIRRISSTVVRKYPPQKAVSE